MSEQVMKLQVDATEAVYQLGEALRVSDGLELESAIASTVSLLSDVPGVEVFERLLAHLDALLAEQRELVSGWKACRAAPLEHVNP